MSQTHIIAFNGVQARCGRGGEGKVAIRGFITNEEYQHLLAEKKLGTRIKTSVKHGCSKRPCQCARRKRTVSQMCQDCIH